MSMRTRLLLLFALNLYVLSLPSGMAWITNIGHVFIATFSLARLLEGGR
jgi:hypothetical protein